MQVSVGDLFAAAIVPSLILVLFYVLFILALAFLKPALAPALKGEEGESLRGVILETLQTSLPPIGLIIIVLGGIFLGVVTPTEAAALGAMGSILLTLFLRSFSLELLRYAAIQTVVFSGMIFAILIGASAFTLVFNDAGGGDLIFDFFSDHLGSPWAFIWVAMGVVFLLGFFIDFIEICFVVVPLFVPLVGHFGIDPIWFAMLLAINLQTSFLTPPFGFALFYLKGAVGDRLKTSAIYQGAVPFILLQLLLLGIVVVFPAVIVY
ncbi:TRAP transporter large permease subunit [Wolinella succinogenes]|uniref:TRAP transporter large permease subunit n=1 Tax=Wolinella succinogenes TaxID=844 RepID=UPI0030C755E8